MSKELIKCIKENIEKINMDYPFENLKGKSGRLKRERVGTDTLDKGAVTFLANNCDCVQKIFHYKGANSYYYYAPDGFIQYIKNLRYVVEYEKLQTKLTTKETTRKVNKI
ncbi:MULTISPECIES: hypothetical protein [Burkholderia cepacia complex]|uniref:hypothetical protein n=1 Tax=Burkholderia cepacia complex TaxID=87882 RepID=UPI0012DB0936|nr:MULTISPECIES: hypothetical protein [Burkholderia cepacia complex]MCA8079887.1 hypothetical protein [Burkholderia cepacia]UKV74418.1 hypothetical protein FOC29_23925 [Burkholderia vietnamiensis]